MSDCIYKLKYYVVVEKMALTMFGNPGFPDAETRIDAARWRIFFFFFLQFSMCTSM